MSRSFKTASVFPGVVLFPAVFILALPYFLQTQADPDLWWHVKVGMNHLASGRIETVDPFSYTAENSAWTNHEWAAEIILASAYLFGNDRALVFVRILIFLLFLTGILILYRARGAPSAFVFLFFLLTLPYFSLYMSLRPHIFTYLFTVASLLCLEHYRRGKTFSIYLFPLLMLLWANLHGGFLLGLGLISAGLGEFYFQNTPAGEARSRESERLVIVLALCLAATLINPYGIRIYAYLWKELTAAHGEISEWEPFLRQPDWGLALAHYALFTAPPLLFLFLARTFQRKPEILFFILSALATLVHRRFFMLLALFGSLVWIEAAAELWHSRTRQKNLSAPWIRAACVLALAILLPQSIARTCDLFRTSGFGLRAEPAAYPAEAIGFLKKNYLGPNLALAFQWGGFAIWNLSPDYKVSIDGRGQTVYPQNYVASYLAAYKKGDVKSFLGGHKADVVLIENGTPMDEALCANKSWTPVYRDRLAVIFILLSHRLAMTRLK